MYGPLAEDILKVFDTFTITLLFNYWERVNNVQRFEPEMY